MKKDTIKQIRQFNRYYTVWLDVLTKGYLGTNFAWPESRVLFEIYICPEINATEICDRLNMDKSYVSRILAKLEKNGYLTRELVAGTKGIKKLSLTESGLEKAKQIDQSGDKQIYDKLKNISPEEGDELCAAMSLIESILRKNDCKEI